MRVVLFVCLLQLWSFQAVGAYRQPRRYSPSNGNCVNYEIPLSISTEAVTFNATKWDNDFGLTDFVSVAATRPSANILPPVTGPTKYDGHFIIAATFCTPNNPVEKHDKTVLLATHGLGFDRSYWSSAFQPEKYNFAEYLIAQGYSIFFYDRLGVGESSSISGFVNQASIQVEILVQLAQFIKSGRYTADVGVPDSLVLLGHSFGSFLSAAAIAASPDAADGAILTGFGFTLDIAVQIEALNVRMASRQRPQWDQLDSGYVTWNDIYGNINNFFKAPTYTVEAVEFTESTKSPLAILEVLTIGSLNFNATRFTGPALVMNGEFDFLVCGGFCPGVIDQPAESFFSNSKAFKTYIQPDTGHALNFHKNATGGYKAIVDYLQEQGF